MAVIVAAAPRRATKIRSGSAARSEAGLESTRRQHPASVSRSIVGHLRARHGDRRGRHAPVKVRARCSAVAAVRSRVVRHADVRGPLAFSTHEGSRAPSTSFPSLTARAMRAGVLLLSQPDHEWRSASGAPPRTSLGDAAASASYDRHPRLLRRRREPRAERARSSASRVAFGKTIPSYDPRIVTAGGSSTPSPAPSSDALDRSSAIATSRRPGPGPAPASSTLVRAPRCDHASWSNPPESLARARNPTRDDRTPLEACTSRLNGAARESPFARRWIDILGGPRARRDRRGSRSRTELPARSLRPSRGSSRVTRDRTTPRCPCFTATIVGSFFAPRRRFLGEPTDARLLVIERDAKAAEAPTATPTPGFDHRDEKPAASSKLARDGGTVRGEPPSCRGPDEAVCSP